MSQLCDIVLETDDEVLYSNTYVSKAVEHDLPDVDSSKLQLHELDKSIILRPFLKGSASQDKIRSLSKTRGLNEGDLLAHERLIQLSKVIYPFYVDEFKLAIAELTSVYLVATTPVVNKFATRENGMLPKYVPFIEETGMPLMIISPMARYHPYMLSFQAVDTFRNELKENIGVSLSHLVLNGHIGLLPWPEVVSGSYRSVYEKTKKGRPAGVPLPGIYHRKISIKGFSLVIEGERITPKIPSLSFLKENRPHLSASLRKDNDFMTFKPIISFDPPLLSDKILRTVDLSTLWPMTFAPIPQRVDVFSVKGPLADHFKNHKLIVTTIDTKVPIGSGLVRGPHNPTNSKIQYHEYKKFDVKDLPNMTCGKISLNSFDKSYHQAHSEIWPDSPFYKAAMNKSSKALQEKYKYREGMGHNMSLLHLCKDGSYGGNEPYPALEQLVIYYESIASMLISKHTCNLNPILGACSICRENSTRAYYLALIALFLMIPQITRLTEVNGKCQKIIIEDQITRLVSSKPKFHIDEKCDFLSLVHAWTLSESKVVSSTVGVHPIIKLSRKHWECGVFNEYGISMLESAPMSPGEWSLGKAQTQASFLRGFSESGSSEEVDRLTSHFSRLSFFRVSDKVCYNQFGFICTPKVLSTIAYIVMCESSPFSATIQRDIVTLGMKVGFSGIMALNDKANDVINAQESYLSMRYIPGSKVKTTGIEGVVYPDYKPYQDEDLYLDGNNNRRTVIEEGIKQYPVLAFGLGILSRIYKMAGGSFFESEDIATIRDSIVINYHRFGTAWGFFRLAIGTVPNKFCTDTYKMIGGVPSPHPVVIDLMVSKLLALMPNSPDAHAATKIMNTKSAGKDHIVYEGSRVRIDLGTKHDVRSVTIKNNRKVNLLLELGYSTFMSEENWMMYGVIIPLSLAFRSAANAKFRIAYLAPLCWVLVTRYFADSMKGRAWLMIASANERLSMPIDKVRALTHPSVFIAADGSQFDTYAMLLCLAMGRLLSGLGTGEFFGLMDEKANSVLSHMYVMLSHRAVMFEFQGGDSDEFGFNYGSNTSGVPPTTDHNMMIMECIGQVFILLDERLSSATKASIADGSWLNEKFPDAWTTCLKVPDYQVTHTMIPHKVSLSLAALFGWGDDSICEVGGKPGFERVYSLRAKALMRLSFLLCGMSLKATAVLVTKYTPTYIQFTKRCRICRRPRTFMSEDTSSASGLFTLPKMINDAAASHLSLRGFDVMVETFISLIPKRCQLKKVISDTKDGNPESESYYTLSLVDAARMNLFYPCVWSRLWIDRVCGRSYLKSFTHYNDLEKDSFKMKGLWKGKAEVGGTPVQGFVPGSYSNPGAADYIDSSRLVASEASHNRVALDVNLDEDSKLSMNRFWDAHGYKNIRYHEALSQLDERVTPYDIEMKVEVGSYRPTKFRRPRIYNVKPKKLIPEGFIPMGVKSALTYEGVGGYLYFEEDNIICVYDDVVIGTFNAKLHPPLQHSCETTQLCQYVFGAGEGMLKIKPVWPNIHLNGKVYSQETLLSTFKGRDCKAISGWTLHQEPFDRACELMGITKTECKEMSNKVEQAIVSSQLSETLSLFSQSVTEIMLGNAIATAVVGKFSMTPDPRDVKYLDVIRAVSIVVVQCFIGISLCDEYVSHCILDEGGSRVPSSLAGYLSQSRILGLLPRFSLASAKET